jgi:hypothetical protein
MLSEEKSIKEEYNNEEINIYSDNHISPCTEPCLTVSRGRKRDLSYSS